MMPISATSRTTDSLLAVPMDAMLMQYKRWQESVTSTYIKIRRGTSTSAESGEGGLRRETVTLPIRVAPRLKSDVRWRSLWE